MLNHASNILNQARNMFECKAVLRPVLKLFFLVCRLLSMDVVSLQRVSSRAEGGVCVVACALR